MRYCSRCVLPETFPGIRFDKQGICNFCLSFKGKEIQKKRKLEYSERFEKLIQDHKGKRKYDALMSYSGGKDSTFTLLILKKKYKLNTLALTFDNGFLPEQTLKNIRIVVVKLGVDHILFKPRFDLLRRLFRGCSREDVFPSTTLMRASTICTACMAIVKFNALCLAIEKKIPFIVFGWSPGQIPLASSIMKNIPQMLRTMQDAVLTPLVSLTGDEIRAYFLTEEHLKNFNFFPYNISPLAFLEYDEKKILKEVNRLGWEAPQDVDSNSTNCLLNSFANIIHKKKHGFHPYAFELAKLVREGNLNRSEALQKLNQSESPRTVKYVKKKLGLLRNAS